MRFVIITFLFLPLLSFSQKKFDFESSDLSDWTQVPANRWDTSGFSPINGLTSLQHIYDNTQAGTDLLSCKLTDLSVEHGSATWTFSIRHGYNPSSSNNWTFYLYCDGDATAMSAEDKLNGYAAGVNHSGYDDILKVYKITDGSFSELISSGINWEKTFGTESAAIIKVERSADGNWSLLAGKDPASLASCGSAFDNDHTNALFMGIAYKYTSSQDMKLWIDDIEVQGAFIKDTIPPAFESIRLLSSHELEIRLDEPIAEIKPGQFFIDDVASNPDSVSLSANGTVYLHFSNEFPSTGTHYLYMLNLSDAAGNTLSQHIAEFNYYLAKPYDIVINEIMPDPDPAVALPACEYIEFLNSSDFDISLKGWKLIMGATLKYFPDILLHSKEYLIVCSAACTTEMASHGAVAAMLSSSSSLNNEGQVIQLRDNNDVMISSVQYSSCWYPDAFKANGGWALEQIDPASSCMGAADWSISADPSGGTPGKRNSVYDPSIRHAVPEVEQLRVLSDSSLFLSFSNPVDPLSVLQPSGYTISNGIGNPIHIISRDERSDTLILQKKLQPGVEYSLQITGEISDCLGNKLDRHTSRSFALPVIPAASDIIINEILFNPKTGCPEFIELYNRSANVVNIGKLVLATRDLSSLAVNSSCRIADEGDLVFPGQYLLITTDSIILQHYFSTSGRIIITSGLPSFYDEEGIVSLMLADAGSIDELHYYSDMHSPLIRNTDGVSLERVYFGQPTADKSNWHSASGVAGYATPGYQNSQHLDGLKQDESITISPEIFTPDNDGKDDYLTLSYQFEMAGAVTSITIYDAAGRRMKRIVNNELLGTGGFFTWDGTDENKSSLPTGIYLIYMELVHPDGIVKKIKRTCVLGGRI